MIGIYGMAKYSMKNRNDIKNSTKVGCYHCCRIYNPNEIKEYTDDDQTCICPYCGIDCVIGNLGLENELTEEKLQMAKKYWFEK